MDKLRNDFDLEIKYKPFFLHPEIPEGGLPIEQFYGGNRAYFAQVKDNFKKMANDVGLPVDEITIIANTKLALMLGEYAQEQGRHEAYHRAVFHAYWAEGKNIGEWDVLSEIMTKLDLALTASDMAARYQDLSHTVDAQFNSARMMGINAIPTFVFGDERIVGAQPYEVIKSLMEQTLSKLQGEQSG